MGSVADRIAKTMLSSWGSKAVDLARWREGRKMALEADFSNDGLARDKRLAGHDHCVARYLVAQNVASLMAESISGMREAKDMVKIVGDAEEEYVPTGPPMSPLTVSYFWMWALFDVRFGRSRETMGSCILRVAPEFDCPPWFIDTIKRMQQSRMGFYVHCGRDGKSVLLREVGTRECISCAAPTGYIGCEGEIWFVRVLVPPHPSCSQHIVFTTPYVIGAYTERAYIDYLERELARMRAKQLLRTDDPYGYLMKYGPEPNHWNEYIFQAFWSSQSDAIFLTGIPDIRQSLPHS